VWLAIIGVVNTALSLYYYVRVVVFMWSPEPEGVSPSLRLSPGVFHLSTVSSP